MLFLTIFVITAVNALELYPIGPVTTPGSEVGFLCCHNMSGEFSEIPEFDMVDLQCGVKFIAAKSIIGEQNVTCIHNNITQVTTMYIITEPKHIVDVGFKDQNHTFTCHNDTRASLEYIWLNSDNLVIGNGINLTTKIDVDDVLTCKITSKAAAVIHKKGEIYSQTVEKRLKTVEITVKFTVTLPVIDGASAVWKLNNVTTDCAQDMSIASSCESRSYNQADFKKVEIQISHGTETVNLPLI
jgi:hypothetical protein